MASLLVVRSFVRTDTLFLITRGTLLNSAGSGTADESRAGVVVRVLGVHPGPLMYTKVFLRLEPLGLELVARGARGPGTRCG